MSAATLQAAAFYLAVPARPTGGNSKVGAIPSTYSSSLNCPPSCPFWDRAAGRPKCFAGAGYHSRLAWDRVTAGGGRAKAWRAFLAELRAILARRPGTRWRHNVAGDLPGRGDRIAAGQLAELVKLNQEIGARGFTYTHKPLTGQGKLAQANLAAVRAALAAGFTINASGNNLEHADALADLGLPVATLVPIGTAESFRTPAGRRGVICPAQTREGVTCASCGLCQRADRSVLVGFLPHGGQAKLADQIARAAGDRAAC